MTRVEWTRYGGDDVEAVVAMLVNRKRPNSIRITPSRGDGGVDILDPKALQQVDQDTVIQVKAFTGPLTSSQKAQIVDSLDALRRDPRWADLAVGEWRLVTPWDPTPEALAWLQAEARSRGLEPRWDGLTAVDNLAAEFPEVVDYYLHGGAGRIVLATETLTQLLRAQQKERLATSGATPLLSEQAEGRLVPGDVVEELRALVAALDTDPHYRYDIEVGNGEMPSSFTIKPGLVSTVFAGEAKRWAKIDIVARCAASLTERPLTFNVTLQARLGSDDERRLREFQTYGTGFDSPMTAVNLSFDLPGNLGGHFATGQVLLGPSPISPTEDIHLRAEVVDPSGMSLAMVYLQLVGRTQGPNGQGIRSVYQEETGAFTLEWQALVADLSSTLVIKPADVTGEPVAKVCEAIRFAALLRHPNGLRLSERYAPASTGSTQPMPELSENADADGDRFIAQVADELALIQEHVTEVIRMPDLSRTTRDQVRPWLAAAALLRGETLTQSASTFAFGLPADSELPEPGTLCIVGKPFELEVGDQLLGLGQYYLAVEAGDATSLPVHAGDDLLAVEVTVPSGKVFMTHSKPDASPGGAAAPRS